MVPIHQRGDRYHQTLPPYLPPGASVPLAQLGWAQPPGAVEWEVWAEGTELQAGRLDIDA